MKIYYKTVGQILLTVPDVILCGDNMIQFKNISILGNENLFRITFNTAFIDSSNKLHLKRWNISPEKLHKDFAKFDADFYVELEFEDFCHG